MKKSLILCFILVMMSGCSLSKNMDDSVQDNDKEEIKIYDCSFTKTYRVVNKLEGYQSVTNTFDYIVVDSFQSFTPVVISIPLNEKEKLEEGKYYEFVYTLKGSGRIDDLEDIDMYLQGVVTIPENDSSVNVDLEIKNTEKTGFDQINEEICGN